MSVFEGTDVGRHKASINKKDGWLSPTERASVSAISLRHIIWITRVTPVCRCLQTICGCMYLATSRESKGHFGLPCVRPWDNRGKCYMGGKRIQCWSNASQHVPIYLQPFTSYSEIIGRELQLFPTPLHLAPLLGVFPLEFRGKV